MENDQIIYCVLCCELSSELNNDKTSEGFKSRVIDLWNVYDGVLSFNQEQLFEAGAFSSLQFCGSCEDLIKEALDWKTKWETCKDTITGHLNKPENQDNWASKQFRTEARTTINKNSEGSADTAVKADVQSSKNLPCSEISLHVNDDSWITFPEPEVHFTESSEDLSLVGQASGTGKRIRTDDTESETREAKSMRIGVPGKSNPYDNVAIPSTVSASGFPCDSCSCVSPTLLLSILHKQEAHLSPDTVDGLKYQCEVCMKCLEANDHLVFSSLEAAPGASAKLYRYPANADDDSYTTYGTFYDLCVDHHESCTGRLGSSSSKPKKERKTKKKVIPDGNLSVDMDGNGAGDLNQKDPAAGMHRSSKRRRRVYKCILCCEEFCSAVSLHLHVREVHDEEVYGQDLVFFCYYCKRTWKKSDVEMQRGPKVKRVIPYSKVTRKEHSNAFSTICDLHLRGCNGAWFMKPQLTNVKLECSKCQGMFALDDEFIMHLRTHYPSNDESLSCPLCCHYSVNTRYFGIHLSREHCLKRTGNNQYYCGQCHDFYVSPRPEVESGRLIPEEIEPFRAFASQHAGCKKNATLKIGAVKCKFCEDTFDGPEPLFKHEIAKHTQNYNSAVCEECGNTYPSVTLLQHHKRIHERKHTCEYCGKGYPTKHTLAQHVRTHTNDRCFKCEICAAGFFTSTHLNRHRDTHVAVAECPCPVCGKFYKNKHDVRNHIYQVHDKRRKTATHRQSE